MSIADADLAARLAEISGRILLELRECGLIGGKSLGKAGDQTANQFLIHAIREQRSVWRGAKRAVVTMCIGGGMGAAVLFEIG